MDISLNVNETFLNSKASARNFFLLSKRAFDFDSVLRTKLHLLGDYQHTLSSDSVFRPNKFNEKQIFQQDKITNIQSLIEKPSFPIIPDIFKAKEENENLILSLFKNETQISFHETKKIKPKEHKKWKLYRVISGHTHWVRCIEFAPDNQWFATGSNDKLIKFWDLASGSLKLSLTGHVNTVRGLAVSTRGPYLFSCGEDKLVKCWDLEQNKTIRSYHGHLSGIYCMALHPSLDVLITGGRDCVARIWDIRTKKQILCLEGHQNTIGAVATQEFDPQVITGSHDKSIKLWDLAMGKSIATLTHHKKSIRALALMREEFTFLSAGSDNVKLWKFPEGKFLRNFQDHKTILHCLAINEDGVVASGGDNGSLCLWDYRSGEKFQEIETIVQPGSLSSENAIFDVKFDRSSSRMITAECDKTIKMWKEED